MMVAARKSRRAWRGRSLVALGLIAFVGLATLVVWRRGRGVAEARDLGKLEAERRELQSQRKALDNDLREAMSRPKIVAAAESRLGMHVASDAEVPSLPQPVNRNRNR